MTEKPIKNFVDEVLFSFCLVGSIECQTITKKKKKKDEMKEENTPKFENHVSNK